MGAPGLSDAEKALHRDAFSFLFSATCTVYRPGTVESDAWGKKDLVAVYSHLPFVAEVALRGRRGDNAERTNDRFAYLVSMEPTLTDGTLVVLTLADVIVDDATGARYVVEALHPDPLGILCSAFCTGGPR